MNLSNINESRIIAEYHEHYHDEWEVVIIMSGTMCTRLDGKQYFVREGDVMVIPPRINHSGNGGVNYTDAYVEMQQSDFSVPFVLHDYDGSIRALFFMIKKVMGEKEENYQRIADSLLNALCEYLKKYQTSSYKYPFVADVKNKIYDNLSNAEFSVSDAVKAMGYNVDYFRRCFKEELGVTPIEYMTSLRIESAKGFLCQRSFESVEKVAMLCGFTDPFYFSKVFRSRIGVSPSEYRRLNKHK